MPAHLVNWYGASINELQEVDKRCTPAYLVVSSSSPNEISGRLCSKANAERSCIAVSLFALISTRLNTEIILYRGDSLRFNAISRTDSAHLLPCRGHGFTLAVSYLRFYLAFPSNCVFLLIP